MFNWILSPFSQLCNISESKLIHVIIAFCKFTQPIKPDVFGLGHIVLEVALHPG